MSNDSKRRYFNLGFQGDEAALIDEEAEREYLPPTTFLRTLVLKEIERRRARRDDQAETLAA